MANFVGNLINWLIGYIMLYIWNIIGFLLGIIGQWQVGYDGMSAAVRDFKMSGVGGTFDGGMAIGA